MSVDELRACLIRPRSNEYVRSIYRKKLRRFEEQCGLAVYLGKTMQSSHSADRAIDLDHKLSLFFAAK
jgi:hypothetical protein